MNAVFIITGPAGCQATSEFSCSGLKYVGYRASSQFEVNLKKSQMIKHTTSSKPQRPPTPILKFELLNAEWVKYFLLSENHLFLSVLRSALVCVKS